MKSKVFTLILALVLCLALAVPVFASDGGDYLLDYADLLTDSEEQTVLARLGEVSAKADMNVAIYTEWYEWIDGSVEAYAEDAYDAVFGETDGILLLIAPTEDWDSVDYWYSTSRGAIELFDDDALDELDETVVPELRDRDFYAACTAFADTCEQVIEGSAPSYVLWVVIALAAGAILSFLIPMSVLKGQLKSVRSQAAAANYVRPGSMHLTQQRDIFLYRRVTRTAKPKDNSNSSGGSHGGRGGRV